MLPALGQRRRSLALGAGPPPWQQQPGTGQAGCQHAQSPQSPEVVTVPLSNSLALHRWRRLTAASAGDPWAYHDIQKHLIIRPLCFLETLNCKGRPSSKSQCWCGMGTCNSAAGNFCPCCVRVPPKRSLFATLFLTVFCPLIWSASFPSAPCFSPISPSFLPLSCTGGRDAMPCPGGAVNPGSSPHLRLGKGWAAEGRGCTTPGNQLWRARLSSSAKSPSL